MVNSDWDIHSATARRVEKRSPKVARFTQELFVWIVAGDETDL